MGGQPRKPSSTTGKEGDFTTTSANGPGGNAKVAYWYRDANGWVKITKARYDARNAPDNPNSTQGATASLGGGLSPVTKAPSASGLRYPKDMTDVSDYVLFEFYDYKPPFGKGAQDTGVARVYDYNQSKAYEKASANYQSIALYMPEDVSSGFRAQWTGKSMSTLAVDALRSMGQDGFDKVSGAVGTITSFTERMAPLAGATALQKATTKLSGDALSFDDIFGSISGSILNPNTELLFSAIDLRNFTLNFKLVPRNDPEARGINDIIKQFQRATLPERNPGTVSGFNANGNNTGINLGFIGMPKLVRVSFMHRDKENTKLPRFKMCAITNVDINYTPDGSFSTYVGSDGQPVAIGLSMGFQETKICFSEEVQNNSVR